MKLSNYIKNPDLFFKRVYNKFYLIPKFIKNRDSSFKLFLNNLQFDYNDYLKISAEIIQDAEFNKFINNEFTKTGINIRFPFESICWPYFLYYLIRKTKPERIVETGVWYGISTSVILRGLNKNKSGILYSIDLPAYFETGGYTDENPYLKSDKRTASLPPQKTPGFIVPDNLKDRWNIILGDSKTHLPVLLQSLKKINIFLHDSLHSYSNMTFEFDLAKEYVKKDVNVWPLLFIVCNYVIRLRFKC